MHITEIHERQKKYRIKNTDENSKWLNILKSMDADINQGVEEL